MKFTFFIATLLVALVAAAAIATASPSPHMRYVHGGFKKTALDEYVEAPDPDYSVKYTNHKFTGLGYTAYQYNLTSQAWLGADKVSVPVWTHQLVIIVPDELDHKVSDRAFLYITGGDLPHSPDAPVRSDDEGVIIVSTIAVKTKMIGAVLKQVPNQRISFLDPILSKWPCKGTVEDETIACTWRHFLEAPTEPTWLAYFPMTKSGVRAMDAVQQVAPQYNGGKKVNDFVVSGASKRGWTTSLVSAVDSRVAVSIPIVLDAWGLSSGAGAVDINVNDSFVQRQWRSYNAFSFALTSYQNLNITKEFMTPTFYQLAKLIDPVAYLERYTMDVCFISSSGDEFQQIDDEVSGGWWYHIKKVGPGRKDLIRNFDTEHSQITGVPEIIESVSALARGEFVHNSSTFPSNDWHVDSEGVIHLKTTIPPDHIDIAVADSALGVSKGKRDFRWAAVGVKPCLYKIFGGCIRPILWDETKYGLRRISDTEYQAIMPPAPKGQFRAFYMQMRWKSPYGKSDYIFTTGTSILPFNKYPFEPCAGGDSCYKPLV